MLPYGLKVVWFSLSLTGLLGNWAVTPVFPRHFFLSAWTVVLYAVADTVLQGIFSLGLIWKMDLFRMPRGFCIAQAALTHVAWACLSGICASITLSTAALVFSNCPRFFRIATRLPLLIALIITISTIALVSQVTLLLKLDAAQPADGLSCDASHPTWVRVLGYAGLTLLLAVPSFVLSVVTAMRILFRTPSSQRTQGNTQKSRPTSHTGLPHDTLTSLPRRDRKRDSKPSSRFDSLVVPESSSQYIAPSPVILPKTLRPESLGRAPAVAKHSKFHLPFDIPSAGSQPQSRRASSHSQATSRFLDSPVTESRSLSRQDADTHSPSPIIFAAPLPAPAPTNSNGVAITVTHPPNSTPEGEGRKDFIPVPPTSAASDIDSVMRWGVDSDRGSLGKEELAYEKMEDEETGPYVFPPYPRIRRVASGLPPWLDETPEHDPSLLRTVIFQIFLALVQVLAAITSLVDIFAQHSTPSPLGTQHVALLLVAWGPCIFIGIVLCPRTFTLHP